MTENKQIDFNDYVYSSIVVSIEHLSLCLLITPQPPKDVWMVMERGLNAFKQRTPLTSEDAAAVLTMRREHMGRAQTMMKDLDEKSTVTVQSDSDAFKSLVFFYILDIMASIYEALQTKNQNTALEALAHVNNRLHDMHKVAEPTLQQLVLKSLTS